MEVVLRQPCMDTGQYWGPGGEGMAQGNGRIPLLAHKVTMEMVAMKLFCMQGKGLCPKHSLGSLLMQPLLPSVCNLQTRQGFSRVGFTLQKSAPWPLQTLTAALK